MYSNTWDEPEHLAAGIELLDRGKYEYDTEHPPLGRVFLAIGPYLAGARSFGTPPPEGTPEGLHILYVKGAYWRDLTLARLGMLPFLVLLLTTTWLWARRLLPSEGAALLAVVLTVSVPPVLGHAALASLDVAAAATTLLALYALQRWLVSARLSDAVFFGLASGVAVVTKFSSVPFIGVSLIALSLAHWATLRGTRLTHAATVAAPARADPTIWRRRVGGLALAALLGLAPVWLVYGPRVADPAGVAFRFNWAVSYLLQQHGLAHAFGVLLSHLWLPRELKDLVNGVVAVKAHNDSGHLSYLLGETRLTGWWYFYLVALAVKTPIPLLIAGPVGLVALALGAAHLTVRLWRALRAPGAAAGAGVGAGAGAGAGATDVSPTVRQMPNHPLNRLKNLRILGMAAVLAALVWQLSTLWRAWPDYLPYFNELVAHPERVLVDSDLDWGQDLHRLEARASQLCIGHLNLAYRGTADLRREPLPPVHILAPHERAAGWVAVSQLARTRNHSDYDWLDAYDPVERVGKTIDLYYLP